MEVREAIKVVRALADGVNPETGEILQNDSVYKNPQVVTALNRAVAALEYLEQREKARQSQPGNAGKRWTRAEEQQVCEELRQGKDFHYIARTHNRTVPSIVARLVKLGRISPNQSAPLFPTKVA
jgi:hypothetical protein